MPRLKSSRKFLNTDSKNGQASSHNAGEESLVEGIIKPAHFSTSILKGEEPMENLKEADIDLTEEFEEIDEEGFSNSRDDLFYPLAGSEETEEEFAVYTEELVQEEVEEEKKDPLVEIIKRSAEIFAKIQGDFSPEEKSYLMQAIKTVLEKGENYGSLGFTVELYKQMYVLSSQRRKEIEREKEEIQKENQKLTEKIKQSSVPVKAELVFSSYIRNRIVEIKEGKDYLFFCGALYCYALQDFLGEMGIEIKSGSFLEEEMKTLAAYRKQDKEQVYAALFRAFNGMEANGEKLGIGLRGDRTTENKTNYRWFLSEIFDEMYQKERGNTNSFAPEMEESNWEESPFN